MRILCVDTTRKMARISVYDTEKDLNYSIKISDNIKHSEGLFLYIEKALFECKLEIKDIDVFAGVVGPGSFTGIRVGMSVLKSFNAVHNKKLIPINTFEILSTKLKKGYILLNSTSTTYYYGKIIGNTIVETGVVEKDKLSQLVNGEKIVALFEEQDLLGIEYNNIEFINDISELYQCCIQKKLGNNDTEEFLPYYLQLSQAERNEKSE